MTPAKILKALLKPDSLDAEFLTYDIEAEPAWFPKGQQAAEPAEEGEKGEAQAIISVDGKAYAISLEELP